jgi:DNA polymerase (family X)
MPVTNPEIAAQLEKIADLLEIEGANPFRVRSYRRAARIVEELPRNVADMADPEPELDALPGIGEDLAQKIAALARGEQLALLGQLERDMPPGITALLEIPGLGPKRVHALHDALEIDSVPALAAAARDGRLRTLPGFGATIERKILEAVARRAGQPPRIKLSAAEQIAAPLLRHLREANGVRGIEIAGSFRRRRETVGDLDIVVAAQPSEPVMSRFVGYEDVSEVVERGPTRATVRLRAGLQVDLRVVAPASYGAALLYFTGSKAHNIELRRIAIAKGWKLNEYGILRRARRIAGAEEDEVYTRLGLPYIAPELRENAGEIEAARKHRLPHLITQKDILGDLHTHSTASDGRDSIIRMAEAAQECGYGYLAITDHSRRVAVAHGLDAKRLARQVREITALNGRLRDFEILASVEVDILEDGSLDLPDPILQQLDLVIAAIHSRFELPAAQQTERLIRAMDNRVVNIIAHPTGRLINERPPYAVDMEQLMRAAKERGCYLELNAQPDRLDLTDVHCRMAKAIGVKVAISTDAHSCIELNLMRYGIDQARRGWLEPADVLNAHPLNELRRLLHRK